MLKVRRARFPRPFRQGNQFNFVAGRIARHTAHQPQLQGIEPSFMVVHREPLCGGSREISAELAKHARMPERKQELQANDPEVVEPPGLGYPRLRPLVTPDPAVQETPAS